MKKFWKNIKDILDFSYIKELNKFGKIFLCSLTALALLVSGIIILPFFLIYFVIKSLTFFFYFICVKKQYRKPYKKFMFDDNDNYYNEA